jgi:hypothetical protein
MRCIEPNLAAIWLQECNGLAAMSSSTEMRSHYSRLSEHDSTPAVAEVLGGLAYGSAILEGGSKANDL